MSRRSVELQPDDELEPDVVDLLADFPDPPPFVVTTDRFEVTGDPPVVGYLEASQHNDQDWVDFAQQGGGSVPEDHAWLSNPKQAQDDLGVG